MSVPSPLLRSLARDPATVGAGHWAARRINRLLAMHPVPTRYLEIGLAKGLTLECVNASARWGIDPSPRFNTSDLPPGVRIFASASDDCFGARDPLGEFHVIYIDGLHHFGQTYRDLVNSLAHLAPNGSILIDDTVPCDEISGIPDQALSLQRRRELGMVGTPWHGDVWKAVAAIAALHPRLEFRTIVGSDNPQTLVWRADGRDEPDRLASPADLERIAALEYSTTFCSGVPALFRPCTEEEAMHARGA